MGHDRGGGSRKKNHTYLDIDNVNVQASRVMSSLDEYLDVLPKEDEEYDEDFKEKFVDLETWLYAPEYMGLDIRLSEIQLEVLKAMDDYNPETNLYTEAVCEWGKGCLAGDELIYSPAIGEWRRIDSLINCQSTVIGTKDGKLLESNASPSFIKGFDNLIEVITQGGRKIKVHNNHKFLTLNGWQALKDLKLGEKIACATKLPINNTIELMDNELILLGTFIGDGIASVNGGPKVIFGENETESINRYKLAIQQFGLNPIVSRQNNDKKCISISACEIDYSHPGRYGRKKNRLRQLLEDYKLFNKTAHEKRIPKCIFSLNEKQLCDFISYLWQTDGYVSNSNTVEAGYTTVNYKLAEDIRNLLLRLGICFEIQSKKVKYNSEIRTYYTIRSRNFEMVSKFCENIILVDKKRNKQLEILKRNSIIFTGKRGTRKKFNEIYFDKIIKMNVLEKQNYYDLHVDDIESYVTSGGILNHNSGKDFVSALCALRCVYWLLCLRNPYLYYNLAKGTGIQLCNVAYTAEQAIYVYFKQVKGLILASPWFMRQNPNIKRSRVDFPQEIQLVSTSTDGDSAEGQNLIYAVMDEASAFKDSKTVKASTRKDGVKIDRAADAIYKVLRSSVNSRFPNSGKVMIISYPRYKDDYIETKLEENKNTKKGFISGPYATWEVNPSRTKEHFNEDYEKNPELADAMYACKPPFAEDGWVKYPERFLRCVVNSAKIPELISPLNEEGIYDPFFKGTPGKLYCVHVDLALNADKCALALASQGNPVIREKCPCGQTQILDSRFLVCSGCGLEREKWLKIQMPTMVVTLLKHFKPRSFGGGRKEVHFADIREEIMFLRDRGHKIWALSYDGWQSRDSIQTMQKLLGKRTVKDRWGQPIREEEIAQTLSVDRDTKAYDTLKEFIYDERFFITPPLDVKKKEDWEESEDPVAIAFREFRGLRLINWKKIDHSLGASKDFTDALAGCAYWVAQMPIARDRGPSISGWRENMNQVRK